jgi:hypothetical protein
VLSRPQELALFFLSLLEGRELPRWNKKRKFYGVKTMVKVNIICFEPKASSRQLIAALCVKCGPDPKDFTLETARDKYVKGPS